MNGTSRNSAAVGAYRTVDGIGSNPEGFMKLALDSASILLLRAETAITEGKTVEKAQALSSAAKCVEFMLGLSGTAPGTLSERLASVYQYVLTAILKGNAGDDAEAVAAARVALDDLAAAWRAMFPDSGIAEDSGAYATLSGRHSHA